MDFKVNDFDVGTVGQNKQASQLDLAGPAGVKVTCNVAALLAEKPTPETEAIRKKRLDDKPYWHLERCRIDDSRKVPVELIVNGKPAAIKKITADGSIQSLSFDVSVKQSSWIALRILPSCHTNPVFVHVGGKPIRVSRSSADWCAKAVDVCWNAKERAIRASEKAAAKEAYDKAREIYRKVLAEAVED
jgi:hypothetical protein